MFNWMKTLWSRFGTGRQQSLALVANWLANVKWLLDTKFITLARDAYGKNSVVYSCVRLLSQSVPEPPLRAYEEVGEGDAIRRVLLRRDNDLVQLIKHPNKLMTEYEFWELITIHVATTGRSVWFKERNHLGKPMALWPLRNDRVAPLYALPDDEDNPVLRGYNYQIPGTGNFVEISRHDILAFNFPDPAGESGGIIEGLGPMQVIAAEISADNEATNFVGALLANYAAPTVVLKTKETLRNEDEARLMKSKFKYEFGGARRGEPAVLDGDASVELLGFNLQQLEFPNVRINAEARICAALGVPPILVGLNSGGTTRAVRENTAQMRRYFTETTLVNYWRRYQDQYMVDVASEFGDNIIVEFDISDIIALSGWRQEKIDPISRAFQLGAVTRNQYLAVLGLPPVEGGDVYVVPLNTMESPAGAIIEETKSPKGLKAANLRETEESRLEEALLVLFGAMLATTAMRLWRRETIGDDEIAEAFRGILEPHLADIVTSAELGLAERTAIAFDPALVNAEAIIWARTYGYDLAKGLTDTTRKVIREAMEQYQRTPGMTRGELQALLEPAFDRTRASAIAVTEVTRAHSQAENQYQRRLADMGVKMERVWITANDEIARRCPICWPKHRRPESEWADAFPGGPPGHVNCRCSLILRIAAKSWDGNGHKDILEGTTPLAEAVASSL